MSPQNPSFPPISLDTLIFLLSFSLTFFSFSLLFSLLYSDIGFLQNSVANLLSIPKEFHSELQISVYNSDLYIHISKLFQALSILFLAAHSGQGQCLEVDSPVALAAKLPTVVEEKLGESAIESNADRCNVNIFFQYVICFFIFLSLT